MMQGASTCLVTSPAVARRQKLPCSARTDLAWVLLLGSVFYNGPLAAQAAENPKLVPWPQEIRFEAGTITLNKRLVLSAMGDGSPAATRVAQTCVEDFRELGFTPSVSEQRSDANTSKISLEIQDDKALGNEGYRLTIAGGVSISAAAETGLFWGTRTAMQLLADGPGQQIPRLRITDKPLLEYRGLMIDVARRFHSIEFHLQMVKKLASYKMNVYQIHFSDDQSYTLPSEKFPKLPTSGRHYTRAQILELVQVAGEYHVTIVPEIDVPGHARALTKKVPELRCDHCQKPPGVVCIGSERTYQILEELFTETMEMIPGPYWHLGADEVNMGAFRGCSACAARTKEQKVTDHHGLYHYFINRMNGMVTKAGRRMLVWEGFVPGREPIVDQNVFVCPFDAKHRGKLPKDYLAAGYRLINTSWAPLYVADRIYMTTPEDLALWGPYMFGEGRSPTPYSYWHKFEPTPQIKGGQMCSWNNEEKAEEGLLFGTGPGFPDYGRPGPRLPIVAERVWTGSKTGSKDLLERVGAAYW